MQLPQSSVSLVSLEELGLKLSELRLCEPASEERMRRSLRQYGQLTAVTAFVDGEKLELVDGFKRFRAGRHLGWPSLQVRTLTLDEATASAVIVTLHEYRGLSELEEGWLVQSLHRKQGLSQGAIALLLRRHKSWVSRRLLLVEGLLDDVQHDVRLGLLAPRSALAVAALPRGNQRRAADLAMKRGMTTRQAERLVRRLSELENNESRDALMEKWPEETAAPNVQGRPRSEHEQLQADVAVLMRVGVRVKVRLLSVPSDITHSDVLRAALRDLNALVDTLNKVIARALELQDKVDATLAKP